MLSFLEFELKEKKYYPVFIMTLNKRLKPNKNN